MLKKDVLSYFDPGRERPRLTPTAEALGITIGAVSLWDEVIPELRARQIHELTQGRMKFRAELYARDVA